MDYTFIHFSNCKYFGQERSVGIIIKEYQKLTKNGNDEKILTWYINETRREKMM